MLCRENIQLKEQLLSEADKVRSRRKSSTDHDTYSGYSSHDAARDAGREPNSNTKDVPASPAPAARVPRKAESLRGAVGGPAKGSGMSSGLKGASAVQKNFSRTNSSPTLPIETAALSASSGAAKETIRDKIRSRGRKLVSGAVERVRDSSTAVTRVFRPGADAESVQWTHTGQMSGHSDGVWELSLSRWPGQAALVCASACYDA